MPTADITATSVDWIHQLMDDEIPKFEPLKAQTTTAQEVPVAPVASPGGAGQRIHQPPAHHQNYPQAFPVVAPASSLPAAGWERAVAPQDFQMPPFDLTHEAVGNLFLGRRGRRRRLLACASSDGDQTLSEGTAAHLHLVFSRCLHLVDATTTTIAHNAPLVPRVSL